MRAAPIAIRPSDISMAQLRSGFAKAWKSAKYQGEYFEFESPRRD